jgi:hypothetical protein
MRQKPGREKQPALEVARAIRRATRGHSSVDEKIRIVREGLRRGEPCRSRRQAYRGTPVFVFQSLGLVRNQSL